MQFKLRLSGKYLHIDRPEDLSDKGLVYWGASKGATQVTNIDTACEVARIVATSGQKVTLEPVKE